MATLTQELDITRNGARFTARRVLVDGATANTNGTWWDTLQLHPFTIIISGEFVANVSILVSNGVASYPQGSRQIIVPPADADNNYPTLGPGTITTPYAVLSDGPYKYVKVRIQNWVSGAVSASFSAALNVNEKG